MTKLTYPQALEWLYARTRAGAQRELGRVRQLLNSLEQPQQDFDALHVLGTNGKGSVSAMLAKGLEAQGWRTGLFTSPHLHDFRERIRIDGFEISQEDVVDFVRWAQAKNLDAAFFDLTVALGFQHFAQASVDIAVIEAGVGGALDATNTLERIKLTIITNIDFDHVATIGPSLRQIALEKAGAIRPGVPVLTAAKGETLEVLRAVALERQAPLQVLDGTRPPLPEAQASQRDLFRLPRAPRLLGMHQLENAGLAVAALRLLGIGEDQICQALDAHWPGRLETMTWQGSGVLLDGAHNPAGARALAEFLEPDFALVFGVFERKNVLETLQPLLEKARQVAFVAPGDLAADPQQLALEHGGQAFAAVELALQAFAGQARIVVAGSLYLVGQARTWLLNHGALAADQVGKL